MSRINIIKYFHYSFYEKIYKNDNGSDNKPINFLVTEKKNSVFFMTDYVSLKQNFNF